MSTAIDIVNEALSDEFNTLGIKIADAAATLSLYAKQKIAKCRNYNEAFAAVENVIELAEIACELSLKGPDKRPLCDVILRQAYADCSAFYNEVVMVRTSPAVRSRGEAALARMQDMASARSVSFDAAP